MSTTMPRSNARWWWCSTNWTWQLAGLLLLFSGCVQTPQTLPAWPGYPVLSAAPLLIYLNEQDLVCRLPEDDAAIRAALGAFCLALTGSPTYCLTTGVANAEVQ